MSPRRLLITFLLFAAFGAAAGWGGLWAYRRVHPDTLDAWVAAVARPGFELRFRTRTATHFFAVFEAGDGQLALCRERLAGPRDTPEAEVQVTDVAGHDLSDPDRPRLALSRVWDFGLAEYCIEDGEIVPIRPGFNGRLRIVLPDREAEETGDSPLQALLPDTHEGPEPLLDTHIFWGERQAARGE